MAPKSSIMQTTTLDMNFNELLKIAINASIKGGHAIMEIYSSDFAVEHKEDKSPLTQADKNCHTIIEEDLINTDIPILSEEGAKIPYDKRKRWKYSWLVDPLDGTKEFVKRNGEFTVNIALIHNGVPKMGVVYAPVNKELYFAMDSLGSYKRLNISKEVSNLNHLISSSHVLPVDFKRETYTIVGSRSHMSEETEEFFNQKKKDYGSVKVIAIGSSLKICMVAEGKADAYPRYAPTMEWDTGAGHAIAKYAGFSVTQYNKDDEVVYNKKNLLNPWFLVK